MQTDTVVRFAPEHVVLFLYLCDFISKGHHKGCYVLLGSSLPTMGGGGFYEIFEKITFISKISKINYRYLSFL